MNETIIISLGGSIIVPEKIDLKFLKTFQELILTHVREGKKFVIITGGGNTAREYQNAAQNLSQVSKDNLDWVGIAALSLNAELVRVMFGEHAHDKVIPNMEQPFSSERPIIIGSAFKPGASTDMDAVFAAKTVGAKRIVNLSNIDHVYDSDPKSNPNARKFEEISWGEFREIIPKDWVSGMHAPFDPIASKMAEEAGLEVIMMNGREVLNLEHYLAGESFQGTIIS